MKSTSFKKAFAGVLALALTAGMAFPVSAYDGTLYWTNVAASIFATSSTTSVTITEVGSSDELAYVEWTAVTGATGYNVYVIKGSTTTQIDSMLIRQYSDCFRADAVGLASGTYTLKIVPVINGVEDTSKAATSSSVTVTSADRSGFSFTDSGEDIGEGSYGSGGYQADGTLASDAQVIYLTADTIDTVTLDVIKDAKGNTYTCTGISEILSYRKKGYDLTPLVIRMVGTITYDDISSHLNSNGYLELKGITNVSFEGIGEDATCYGWGILVRQATNVEIKNVGLMLFPDDGISLDTDNCNIWIHNCDFFYGAAGSDADQVKGDGSLDVKNDSRYITFSYNHFWDSGKSSLCGMKSESGDNYITYHHNWFDHSDSRHPRIRSMSVHVYNNYYDGNAKYGVGVTYGASCFVENNYFRNCKYPMLISMQGSDTSSTFSSEDGGIIKAYGNIIVGAKSYITYAENSTSFDAYEVSSRSQTVPSSVTCAQGGTSYNNFDTDSSIMYSYTADAAEDVPTIVTSKAGRLNGGDFTFTFTEDDDEDYSVNTELMAALVSYTSSVVAIGSGFTDDTSDTVFTTTTTTTTTATTTTTTTTTVSGDGTSVSASDYVHNFTLSGTESSFYTISGNLSTSKGTVSYNGLTLTQCLKMESATSITFTSTADGTLTLVFAEDDANAYIDGTKYTATSGIITLALSAGAHTITKADTCNLFYMSYASTTTASTTATTAATTTTTTTTTAAATTTTTTGNPSTGAQVYTQIIYCSPNGTGTGTSMDSPTDIYTAIANVPAGGLIYLLDGTYNLSETVIVDQNNSGTASAPKTISAYPGATVVWDFSSMSVADSNRGVVLDGSYWHWYGFEITKAGDNGMLLSGSNNTVEMMVFSECQDTGLQISRYRSSAETIDTWPSNNLVLNCTSHDNCDDATMENADGFAAKLTCGEGNVFDGCMSYNNSDDGWDLYAKSATGSIGVVTLQNCIAFRNGYTQDGRGYGDCDGNGFKLGGSGVGTAHVVINCLAFENLNCGFTDNNNPDLGQLINCTAYNNGVGNNSKPNFSTYRCTDCDFSLLISYYNTTELLAALAPGFTSTSIANDKFVGTMTESVYYNGSKYYNVTSATAIDNGDKIGTIVSLTDSDFISLSVPSMGTDFHTVWRNEDGTLNTSGFAETASTSTYADLGYHLTGAGTASSIPLAEEDGGSTLIASYGDADCDGDVDVTDVIAISQATAGTIVLNEQGLLNADVDLSNKVDATDALCVLRYLSDLISSFPVQ